MESPIAEITNDIDIVVMIGGDRDGLVSSALFSGKTY